MDKEKQVCTSCLKGTMQVIKITTEQTFHDDNEQMYSQTITKKCSNCNVLEGTTNGYYV